MTKTELIKQINTQRELKVSPILAKNVRKVIVILTASRGGSSLVKEVLTQSPNLIYMSGEETPLLTITYNEFPFVSSDELTIVHNKELLLMNIFDDLGMKTIDINKISLNELVRMLRNRFLLQLGSTEIDLSKNKIKNILLSLIDNYSNYEQLIKQLLLKLTNRQYTYLYDGFFNNSSKVFNLTHKIEDTPYVIPKLRKQITKSQLEKYPLLFKTPQNAYRIGLFKKLFPNAEVKYIHMTRGFAQSVNGLMDGWLYDRGFFAKHVSDIGLALNIEDYTDVKSYGKSWWKFDLPPNWTNYINMPLKDVCLNQWYSAHEHILNKKDQFVNNTYIDVKFEDFILNPQKQINKITQFIGIPKISVGTLPLTMITKAPKKQRWMDRYYTIMSLSKYSKTKSMMNKLNYTMEEQTWI